jgi:adenosylmethionine-8-amino-7-oxononanoate aminotransferase
MAVFSPPLIITLKQIDEMFDILETALLKVQNELKLN